MRNPGGYGIITDRLDGKITEERDTFTCGHCQFVVEVKPFQDPASLGGLCKICMKLICPPCYGKDRCRPWEKALEKSESRDRFLRSAGLYEH